MESDKPTSQRQTPTVLVILGATGDLTAKKVIPSLFHLYTKGKLPKMLRIIGFSRRDWTDEQFRKHVKQILLSHKSFDNATNLKKYTSFSENVAYVQGNFNSLSGYKELAGVMGRIDDSWQVCANKLFYLAVPPKYYKKIFTNLEQSGLTEPCSPEEGWTRIIVEKPFGKDLKTARDLDSLLSKLFKEEQIYRIDHYLAKEILQNILAFRFSNNIFEQSWNNKFIESIKIKVLEEGGISDRGTFYDGVGALRDVGQNHLIQMLALVTMHIPSEFKADELRAKRAQIISSLQPMDADEIAQDTFRAQYVGYKNESGVVPGSQTETYFKVRANLNIPGWHGVPIVLEGGKALRKQKKEIVVTFKHPSPCLCPPGSDHLYSNKIIFAIEPKEEITLRLWTKTPGYDLTVERRSFDLPYRHKSKVNHYTEEYEKLLVDCFAGDQSLFVSTDEVEAMWRFTDPIVEAWHKGVVPLETYPKTTDAIRDKVKYLDKSGHTGRKELAVVGLGKMGANLARQLYGKGWRVVGFNRSEEVTKKLEKEGIEGAYTLDSVFAKLKKPRIVWLMVPAGAPVAEMVDKLAQTLEKGDIVVDGGNSLYEESKKNAKKLVAKGIEFVDVGVSGGPAGARYGACLMIGGKRKVYDYLTPLFTDISVTYGFEFFEGYGAGHFVKMVHNAIEYGMMQAIAEGFDVMKNADYKLHLGDIARVYNRGSVIEGRLINWMQDAYNLFGDRLEKVSGKAGSGGAVGMKNSEAKWTLDVAKKLKIKTTVIEDAITARLKSQKQANYQGKVVNALRNRFGGHSISKD